MLIQTTMKVKEKTLKQRGRPGFTNKQLDYPNSLVEKVDWHKKELEVKQRKTLTWDAALMDLLERATSKIIIH